MLCLTRPISRLIPRSVNARFFLQNARGRYYQNFSSYEREGSCIERLFARALIGGALTGAGLGCYEAYLEASNMHNVPLSERTLALLANGTIYGLVGGVAGGVFGMLLPITLPFAIPLAYSEWKEGKQSEISKIPNQNE